MNRKTIYIAGPMAGLPNNNRSAFLTAHERLNRDGWCVVTPIGFDAVFGLKEHPDNYNLLRACMESELAAIPFLDAIYLLKGWEKSKGARKELKVALEHGLQIIVEESEERKAKQQTYEEMVKSYGVKPLEILVPAKRKTDVS